MQRGTAEEDGNGQADRAEADLAFIDVETGMPTAPFGIILIVEQTTHMSIKPVFSQDTHRASLANIVIRSVE